ncbi:helix-turn-helix domain-containing protein [Paenibacillus sp. NRS-1760]|uniref:helix-turn-helix domain-containing protein n=1 Tax=Paenibacillus sp. NRS-1760 TaxID=3233902 RepID=UPI003D26C555
MNYKDLLKKYIDDSGLSLREIEEKMRSKGLSTNKAYISKLQNGIHPPAGEEITRALAEVTGGDAEDLILAGYIDKAPEEIKNTLLEAQKKKVIFVLIEFLVKYVENHRSDKSVDPKILHDIELANYKFARDYKYELDLGNLPEHPEHAITLLSGLRDAFFPLQDTISQDGIEINFSDYLPTKTKNIMLQEAQSTDEEIVIKDAFERKIQFFKELEDELGLDLNDPAVQNMLKGAAKILFAKKD